MIVRNADDFVMSFEKVADARPMVIDLKERLAGFSLQLDEKKTRLIAFGRFAARLGRPGATSGPKPAPSSGSPIAGQPGTAA